MRNLTKCVTTTCYGFWVQCYDALNFDNAHILGDKAPDSVDKGYDLTVLTPIQTRYAHVQSILRS